VVPWVVESEVSQPMGMSSSWRRAFGIMSGQGTTTVSSYVMMLQKIELPPLLSRYMYISLALVVSREVVSHESTSRCLLPARVALQL
jgi:hypothetical protein